MISQRSATELESTSQKSGEPLEGRRVFPPALVPMLRTRLATKGQSFDQLEDELLLELITTIFFASLETHEGAYQPIRVVFVGRSAVDLVLPQGAEPGGVPSYRWKVLRFAVARSLLIPELVKLAAARRDERLYTVVSVSPEDRLQVSGLGREGIQADGDPFIEIVALRPGRLSIRSGHEGWLEYERGTLSQQREHSIFAASPLHDALARAARNAGIEADGRVDYVSAVRGLVAEMAAHGHGGILVISSEEHPMVKSASYRMSRDASIASLLRLSARLRSSAPSSSVPQPAQRTPYGSLLRDAFSAEQQRMIEEYGALTSIDGATVLNCSLALVAFGVVLPVAPHVDVAPAESELELRRSELRARGTRHRAATAYAAAHLGSVVFVASADGPVSCLLRESASEPVLFWHVGAGDLS